MATCRHYGLRWRQGRFFHVYTRAGHRAFLWRSIPCQDKSLAGFPLGFGDFWIPGACQNLKMCSPGVPGNGFLGMRGACPHAHFQVLMWVFRWLIHFFGLKTRTKILYCIVAVAAIAPLAYTSYDYTRYHPLLSGVDIDHYSIPCDAECAEREESAEDRTFLRYNRYLEVESELRSIFWPCLNGPPRACKHM